MSKAQYSSTLHVMQCIMRHRVALHARKTCSTLTSWMSTTHARACPFRAPAKPATRPPDVVATCLCRGRVTRRIEGLVALYSPSQCIGIAQISSVRSAGLCFGCVAREPHWSAWDNQSTRQFARLQSFMLTLQLHVQCRVWRFTSSSPAKLA